MPDRSPHDRPAPSDFDLLDAWRAGQASAGEALFERHFESLYRFFRNKVSDGADDLVQSTLLGCLEGRDRFRGDASFRTFLFSVARFQLLERYRKTRRDAARIDLGHVSAEDLGTSPSGIAVRQQEHEVLLRALRSLPIDMQIALELTFWEGLSGPEVAEVLQQPLDTTYSKIRRAKLRLREHVARLAAAPGLDTCTVENLEQWASGVRGLLAN